MHTDDDNSNWIDLPRLVGSKGACKLLGVDKMTLHRWTRPNSGMLGPERTYMIPPRRVGDGGGEDSGWPVWAREDVERFALEVGRQRAPKGESKADRNKRRDPAALREQIAALQAELAAAETSPTE